MDININRYEWIGGEENILKLIRNFTYGLKELILLIFDVYMVVQHVPASL